MISHYLLSNESSQSPWPLGGEHPLVQHFILRREFSPNTLANCPQYIINCLNSIPLLNGDKRSELTAFLSRSDDIRSAMNTFGYKILYSSPFAESNIAAIANGVLQEDLKVLALSHTCLMWSLDESHPATSEEFSSLLISISRHFHDGDRTSSILNYAFFQILFRATRIQALYSDASSVLTLLSFIEVDASFPLRYSEAVITFFRKLFSDSRNPFFLKALRCLIRMISLKRQSAGYPHPEPLYHLISTCFGPLNQSRLFIGSGLTNWGNFHDLIVEFRDIPHQLLDKIRERHKSSESLLTPSGANMEFIENEQSIEELIENDEMKLFEDIATSVQDSSELAKSTFFQSALSTLIDLKEDRIIWFYIAGLIQILRQVNDHFFAETTLSATLPLFSQSIIDTQIKLIESSARRSLVLFVEDIHPDLVLNFIRNSCPRDEFLLRILIGLSPAVIETFSSDEGLFLLSSNKTESEISIQFNIELLQDQKFLRASLLSRPYIGFFISSLNSKHSDDFLPLLDRSLMDTSTNLALLSQSLSELISKPGKMTDTIAEFCSKASRYRGDRFGCLFDDFLNVPSFKAIDFCFEFISNSDSGPINAHIFSRLFSTLSILGPSDELLSLFIKSFTQSTSFIQKPEFLPIFLASFASRISEIILILKKYCEESIFNCQQCHCGSVDSILLTTLLSPKVEILSEIVEFPPIDPSFIFDLVGTIASFESDPQISDLYLRLISTRCSKLALHSLCLAIDRCRSEPNRQFPLGFESSFLRVSNIAWEALKEGFRVSIRVHLDFKYLSEYGTILRLFSVESSPFGSFAFIFHRGSIFISFESLTYTLAPFPPFKGWTEVAFIFEPDENGVTIYPSIGDSEANSYSIKGRNDSKKVNFSFGGNGIEGRHLGALGSIRIESKGQNLFDTDWKHPEISAPNRNISSFVRADAANEVTKCMTSETFADTLSLISDIFFLSKEAQQKFENCYKIETLLKQKKELLTIDNFNTLSNCLTSIDQGKLLSKALFGIVVNPWIWVNSQEAVFEAVLMKWESSVIQKFSNVFEAESSISYIKAFFCLFYGREFGANVEAFDGYSKEGIEKCKMLYYKFLCWALRIESDQSGSNFLFQILSQSPSDEVTEEVLSLILIIFDKRIFHVIHQNRVLALISSKLPSISAKATLVSHLISRSMKIPLQASNELVKSIHIRNVFDELLIILPSLPNIIHVLCLISIEIGGEMRSILVSILQASQININKFTYSNFWFMWLLFLGSCLQQTEVAPICETIVQILIGSPHKENDIRGIFYLLELMQPTESIIAIRECIISGMISHWKAYNIQPSLLYEMIFCTTFFHVQSPTHSRMLISQIAMFEGKEIELRNEEAVVKINTIKALFERDPSRITSRFEMRLDSNRRWIDKGAAVLALNVYEMIPEPNYREVAKKSCIGYFINRSINQAVNVYEKEVPSLYYLIDWMYEEYTKDFLKDLSEFLVAARPIFRDPVEENEPLADISKDLNDFIAEVNGNSSVDASESRK